MSGLGETLRAAREARGLTLAEVERRTRVRTTYLAALENEDLAPLPPRVYVEGMVRVYGACLGLDREELLRQLDAALGPASRPGVQAHLRSLPGPSSALPSAVATAVIVVLLLLLAGLGYLLWQGETEPAIGLQMPAARGAAAPAATDERPLLPQVEERRE